MVLGALLFALLLGEVIFRLRGAPPLPHVCSDDQLLFVRVDPPLEYVLRPSFSTEAWSSVVNINEYGYRGPVPSVSAQERTVVLGDSIAFGLFLSQEDVFSERLRIALSSDGAPVDVINLAVPGYDTVQEVALLESHADLGAIDRVIVQYSLNDVEVASPSLAALEFIRKSCSFGARHSVLIRAVLSDGARYSAADYHQWANEPEQFRRRYAEFIRPIPSSEATLHRLMDAVRTSVGTAEPAGWYADYDRVGRLRASFEHLARLARTRGFSVHVLMVPLLVLPEGKYPFESAHRVVAYESQRVGFDFIDLTDDFVAAKMLPLRLPARPDDDVHPNAIGHRLIAKKLAEVVWNDPDAARRAAQEARSVSGRGRPRLTALLCPRTRELDRRRTQHGQCELLVGSRFGERPRQPDRLDHGSRLAGAAGHETTVHQPQVAEGAARPQVLHQQRSDVLASSLLEREPAGPRTQGLGDGAKAGHLPLRPVRHSGMAVRRQQMMRAHSGHRQVAQHDEPRMLGRKGHSTSAQQLAWIDGVAIQQVLAPGLGHQRGGPLEISAGLVPEGAQEVRNRSSRCLLIGRSHPAIIVERHPFSYGSAQE